MKLWLLELFFYKPTTTEYYVMMSPTREGFVQALIENRIIRKETRNMEITQLDTDKPTCIISTD